MGTFMMLGKYNQSALKSVSATRTRKAEHLIARYQGSIKAMYALLGEYDLVIIVDLPGIEEAIRVSISLTNLTGISFVTSPAVSVTDFDAYLQSEG